VLINNLNPQKMKNSILSKIGCLIVIFYSILGFSQNYDPDFFPVGVWSVKGNFRSVDDFLYDVNTAAGYHHTSFQNLKAQGFNAAYLSYEPITYTLDTILDIAEINDIRVIPAMNNLHNIIAQSNENPPTSAQITQAIENDSISRMMSSPQILGYYLYDEPLSGWIDFDVLQNARNILTDMTADAPHPILSTWNYEPQMSYIDGYLNLDVLMMDAYPFEDGDPEGDVSDYMPSYSAGYDLMPFSDYINTVRTNHCEAQDRPLWVVLQAFGDLESPENGGYWRQVFPKEIRLEVSLAIMQGAKGIWYFLYESEYPYLLGLLDVSGQPTQRLTEVIAINERINQISEILLKLKVSPDQSAVAVDKGEVKLHVDVTSQNEDKYIYAVNTNVFDIEETTITVAKSSIGYNVLSIIDMNTNESISFSETSETISFVVNISEGDGNLFKLSNVGLAIDDLLLNNVFITPNPVFDTVIVHHSGISIDKYKIVNVVGKTVKEGNLPESGNLNIESLNSGLYYIILKTDKASLTRKLVKQ
jgi:hypothetical protein